ncbi:MAG: CDP-alcohol phosphatidyltransferase family protein [Clostridia bacterium]|nr:CDP-alcohol phosphatidyltransferase family protein [Clostridia bacterium]
MKFSRKDVWTIPNILTYIRLLCVPIFFVLMVLYCVDTVGANAAIYIWAAFALFVVAEITDVCDGYIARHFNMVSDIGKVLDPVADKLLQSFAVLMMAAAFAMVGLWPITIFAIILIVKEIAMGVFSYYFMKASKRQVEQMANKWGKAGAAINFIGLVLGYLVLALMGTGGVPSIVCDVIYWIDFAVLAAGALLSVFNVFQYNIRYYKELQKVRASGILETLDDKGNPLDNGQGAQDNIEE